MNVVASIRQYLMNIDYLHYCSIISKCRPCSPNHHGNPPCFAELSRTCAASSRCLRYDYNGGWSRQNTYSLKLQTQACSLKPVIGRPWTQTVHVASGVHHVGTMRDGVRKAHAQKAASGGHDALRTCRHLEPTVGPGDTLPFFWRYLRTRSLMQSQYGASHFLQITELGCNCEVGARGALEAAMTSVPSICCHGGQLVPLVPVIWPVRTSDRQTHPHSCPDQESLTFICYVQ